MNNNNNMFRNFYFKDSDMNKIIELFLKFKLISFISKVISQVKSK